MKLDRPRPRHRKAAVIDELRAIRERLVALEALVGVLVAQLKRPATGTAIHVVDPIPAVCSLKDIGHLLGLKPTRTWELYKRGQFNFALITPVVGKKPRFSGRKLQLWCERELETEDPNATRGRRYFKGHRR
jgi:hypothetical protein